MPRRPFLPRRRLAWLIVCLLAVAACGAPPRPPLRVGAVLWPGNELLYLAEARGWLPVADFRLVEYASGLEVVRAFRSGMLEAASMTLDEMVRAAADGLEPVALVAIDESVGADAVIGRRDLASLADLRGRRVGLQVNSVSAYVLRRALQGAGLTAADLQVVNVAPERHRLMFDRGEVDAVVTYEPYRTGMLDAGAVELFNSRALAGEILDVLVVRRDVMNGEPARVAALHRAWQQAQAGARAVDALALAARRFGVTPAAYEAMLAGLTLFDVEANRRFFAATPPALQGHIEHVARQLAEVGLIAKPVDAARLVQWPPGVAREVWVP